MWAVSTNITTLYYSPSPTYAHWQDITRVININYTLVCNLHIYSRRTRLFIIIYLIHTHIEMRRIKIVCGARDIYCARVQHTSGSIAEERTYKRADATDKVNVSTSEVICGRRVRILFGAARVFRSCLLPVFCINNPAPRTPHTPHVLTHLTKIHKSNTRKKLSANMEWKKVHLLDCNQRTAHS